MLVLNKRPTPFPSGDASFGYHVSERAVRASATNGGVCVCGGGATRRTSMKKQ